MTDHEAVKNEAMLRICRGLATALHGVADALDALADEEVERQASQEAPPEPTGGRVRRSGSRAPSRRRS